MKMRLSSLALLLLSGTAVQAADLYQPAPQPPIEAPEVAVQEAGGWYLRGDVGYSFNKLRGADFFQGSNASLASFSSVDLKDSFSLGAGVGYQVNNYLRTDLTFDYLFKSDFNGSTRGGCGISSACTSRDLSSMRAYTLMANAYVDLGTYGYFTPYVGAGIGGAYVNWSNLNNTACADNGSGCDGSVDHDGKGSWRFAYQLMAGASIDVTCNIKADAGYRYRRIEGGDMFGYKLNGGPGYDRGIESHELRLGARYVFTDCAPPPTPVAYQPPPAIYK